MLCKRVIAN